MRGDNTLFTDKEFREESHAQGMKMWSEIDGYNPNALLNTSVDDLCLYFTSKYAIVPVFLDQEGIAVSQAETQIDVSNDQRRIIIDRSRPVLVPGVRITFCIPFTGDAALFRYRPSSFFSVAPRGRVSSNEVFMDYERTDHDPVAIRAEFNREFDLVQSYIENANRDAESFNRDLQSNARQRITSRRDRLMKDQGLVAALGFPLKVRPDAPRTYAVPEVRRRVQSPPPASTAPFVPEPTLESKEYERILDICASMAIVLERSPGAFKTMGEEDIRQQFLVQLNGHYEGQATGETFNGQGKTDILIRAGGANIFIAECKFWSGPKAFLETIDQLLGYVTWRDTKSAIFMFNKNKDFSAVISAIDGAGPQHPNYKRAIQYGGETAFRWVLHQTNDRNREIILTVLAFDVPH